MILLEAIKDFCSHIINHALCHTRSVLYGTYINEILRALPFTIVLPTSTSIETSQHPESIALWYSFVNVLTFLLIQLCKQFMHLLYKLFQFVYNNAMDLTVSSAACKFISCLHN